MVQENLPTEPRQQGEYDEYDSGPGRSAAMVWGLRAAGLIAAGVPARVIRARRHRESGLPAEAPLAEAGRARRPSIWERLLRGS